MTTLPLEVFTMNADNFRGAAVADELRTIADLGPDVIGILEAIGNPLPDLPGYGLIRDESTNSRRNIAAYVKADLHPSHVRWYDCYLGWPRTKYAGQHEPRSFVAFRVGGRVRVVVAHQPPVGATRRAKAEHLARLAAVVNRGVWPVVVLADMNGASKALARLTRAGVYGWKVDTAIARGIKGARFKYVSQWPRINSRAVVHFGGDHGDVYRGSFDVPAVFLKRQDQSAR